MTKLKCWKKQERSKAGGVDTTFFLNKSKREQIRVIGKTPKGKYFVAKENFEPFSINKIRGSEKDNRAKALKFANKYMKEHDKC